MKRLYIAAGLLLALLGASLANADLIAQLELLAEMEQASVVNVL